jgi:Sec-independent protein translocase protein TatA
VGALDPEKILMILVVALIVLGPDKLPKVARQLGAGWRELLKFRDKVEREVRQAIPDMDLPRIPTSPRAAVAGFLTDLTSPLSQPLEPEGAEGAEGAEADGAAGGPPAVVPAAVAPPNRSTVGRPLALDQPLVAPDDPSMN